MKKTGFFLVVIVALASFMVLTASQKSEAVPSFARQLKKPCTACHTIWPELNAYGRQFKVKAYTDASPDWGTIHKDRLDLFTVFPLSVHILYRPYQMDSDGTAMGPKGPVNNTELQNAHIILAGRIYKYAGIFTQTSGAKAMKWGIFKLGFWHPIAGNPVQILFFRGLATSSDPFASLGGWDRNFNSTDAAIPWVLAKGWTGGIWGGDNYGIALDGFLHLPISTSGSLYWDLTGLRSGAPETDADLLGNADLSEIPSNPFTGGTPTGTVDNTQQPVGGYARLAWDQKLSNGWVTFGGMLYSAPTDVENPTTGTFGRTRIVREYIDASTELDYGMHSMVLGRAIYGHGEESGLTPFGAVAGSGLGPGDKRRFDGGAVEASYWYDRTYGVVGGYNFVSNHDVQAADWDPAGRQGSWYASVNYLPMLNVKVQLEYAETLTDYVAGNSLTDGNGHASPSNETDHLYRALINFAF